MQRILIGNIKGPQGAQGIQGPQGPVGATGPQGPMPDLVNNALATEAGVAALDAVMGKTLQDQITDLNSNTVKTFSDDGAQSVNYLYQNGYGEIVATTEDEVSSVLALKSDLGQYTTWTPSNLTVSTPHRCYYVKNGATLTVWLMGALNETLPANGIKVICSDIKTRFGVSNAYDAFGIGYGGTIPVKITAVSNELKVEALGTEVASGAFIFGYVTLGIK